MRPSNGRVGILLLSVALLASAVQVARSASGGQARLVLFDQWVQQGSTVFLRARLMSGTGSLFRSAISGERVEFQVNGQSLGPVLTGGDGLAVARYTSSKKGTYTIKAALVPNPRYEAEGAEALLIYGSVPQPVIILSVSATQALPEPPRFPLAPSSPTKPMAKATEVLAKLSKRDQLIYVQGGDEARLLETREWLSAHGFPRAPLFLWQLSDNPETRTERMVEELKALKPLGRLSLGITRLPAEALAFQSLGMQAILIIEEDEEVEIPQGAKTATDWDALPSLLK